MFTHGPSCLRGPVTQTRDWWSHFTDLAADSDTAARPIRRAAQKQSSSRRPPANAPIRTKLVQKIRREIALGTYETPEKWQAALERLLEGLE